MGKALFCTHSVMKQRIVHLSLEAGHEAPSGPIFCLFLLSHNFENVEEQVEDVQVDTNS